MELIDTKKAARMLRVTPRRVLYLLQQQRIKGAYKSGKAWTIPLYRGKPKVSRGKRGPAPRWGKPYSSAVKAIYVSRQVITKNKQNNEFEPVISLNQGNYKNIYAHEADIKGPCRIIYNLDKPHDGGATLWIETYAEVEMIRHSA
ncbi:MAG: hypothetical protein WA865_15995 [Spirulinaceae cyanobacterium]